MFKFLGCDVKLLSYQCPCNPCCNPMFIEEVCHVRAAVISGYRSHQVLLGNSFLKRVEMSRTKRVMILKKK